MLRVLRFLDSSRCRFTAPSCGPKFIRLRPEGGEDEIDVAFLALIKELVNV